MIALMLQLFGGRGGAAGARSGASSSVKIGGYTVSGGVVTSPSGSVQKVESFRDLTASEKRQFAALIEKGGLEDPVSSGRFLLPRKVAEASVAQANAAKEASARKIEKNVPGLAELRGAKERYEVQSDAFRSSIYRGDARPAARPNGNDVASLTKKYPRADAYLKAEKYAMSSDYRKSDAGKRAMQAIASGSSYKKAIQEMEREWKNTAKGRLWD